VKKEVKLLLERAINSLILSIDHFNRPWDRGRVEAVLIFIDHSFELLMKASILHKGGKIWKKGRSETYGFDKCVRTCISNKIITEEQALTIQAINSLRDAAQHYLVEVSEQQLYLHSQAGLTLFKDILTDTFQKNLTEELPERVLPISTIPPLDINTFFVTELEEVKKLLYPGSRKKKEATVKLRALTIFDKTLRGETHQPSESYLENVADQVKNGVDWKDLFPGAAAIDFTTDGTGHNVSLRFTKKEGIPVKIVPEGTPGVTVALKPVNELSYYSLNHKNLARKVGITSPKLTALVKHMNIKEDGKCFKLIKIGKSTFDRYSPKAIGEIKRKLEQVNLNEVWEEYKKKKKMEQIYAKNALK